MRALGGGATTRLAQVLVLLALGAMAAIYLWIGDGHSDIGVYHRYALAFFEPGGAARQLPREYPPLSLIPFSLTLVPLGVDYAVVFVGAMAALFIAGWAAVSRTYLRSHSTAFAVYLLLAGPWTLLGRYDLVPALVVLAAVATAERHRWRWAYALLAIGVLLKLYPLFLLPLFLLEQWRLPDGTRRQPQGLARMGAGPAIFGLVVLAGVGVSALMESSGWLSPVRYALGRPVEAESLAATTLWLFSGFSSSLIVDRSLNSVNVISGSGAVAGAAGLVALAAGSLAVYMRQIGGKLTLRQACLASLAVLIATSKVLSPQYLVWLLPLVALEVGLEPLWIGVCVLTFIVYPILFELAGLNDPLRAATFPFAFFLAAATRNALLVIATWRAVRGPRRAAGVAAG